MGFYGAKTKQKPVNEMSYTEFKDSGLTIPVLSSRLKEKILFAANNALIPRDNGLVVYRASELYELLGTQGADLKNIHEVKRQFGQGTKLLNTSKKEEQDHE